MFALVTNVVWIWPFSLRQCESKWDRDNELCSDREILLEAVCGLLRALSAFSLFLRLIFNASMFSKASDIAISLWSIIFDLFVVVLVIQVTTVIPSCLAITVKYG